MREPFEAAARIVAAIESLDPTHIPLPLADGLVLAEDVVSPISLPLWANSAMDGYACMAVDVAQASNENPVTLRVIEDVRAGQFPTRALALGEATRIATGAPVPDGADTVIRVEDTDGGTERVRIHVARDTARNVRPAGEDVKKGETVVRAGARIGPAQIALLAAVGARTVRAYRRPRVAIVTTGDELVPLERFDEVLAGKRIVSSNSYALAAQVRSAGGEPVDIGIIPDDAAAIRAALERASECDMVITSAGVSVGEADHIKRVVEELGGSITFWRVRMRPGSPLAFGTIRGKPWLGLPGNPVSSFVTFELFGRPAIRKLMGHTELFARRITVVAAEPFTPTVPLTHFVRVQLDRAGETWHATLSGPQPSNILSSLARADALMIVPAERGAVRQGEELEAIPLF